MPAPQESGENRPQLPYSKSLVNVQKFGEERARKLTHSYLHSENFFLGLLQDHSIIETLHQLNIDQEKINICRKIVEEFISFLNPGEDRWGPQTKINPSLHLKKILELASIEADQANAKEINPIHALIGVILVKEKSAIVNSGTVLGQIGITEESIPFLREKARELDLRLAA